MTLQFVPLQLETIPPNGVHIFIKGKIQGRRVRFLLDTGASKSVIDQQFADDFFPHAKREITEHLTTGLGANIPNAVFVKLRGIKAGSASLKPITFAVLDLQMVNEAYTSANLEPVVAIIGGDVLKKYKAVIDYGEKILSIHSKH